MKTLVLSDDETARVEIMTISDPMLTLDATEDLDPFYAAQCRTGDCVWNSFVDQNTLHVTAADALDDAEFHIQTLHTDRTD